MNDNIEQLTKQLSALSVKRSKTIAALQLIDKEHKRIESLLEAKKEDDILVGAKKEDDILVGKDSKGNPLHIGDSVTTLTKGKYYKRIATVVGISDKNHIDIQYKSSKTTTWRVGHNLLKLK